jgi:hypothetical protein
MLARGYRGEFQSLSNHVMRGRDWLSGLAAGLALVALQWIGRLG